MVISDLWWHHAQIRCWSARCSPQLSCKYSGKTQDSTAICQWMCVWHIQIAPVVVESWVAYDVIWHVQWILDILSTSRQTIELFIHNCVLPQKRKVLTVLLCTPLNVHSRACYKGTTPWCKCSRPHLTHQISCDNYKCCSVVWSTCQTPPVTESTSRQNFDLLSYASYIYSHYIGRKPLLCYMYMTWYTV